MLDYVLKSNEKFDLGVARHLFGKMKKIEDPAITLKVIQNLENLLPAIKNVCLFLIKVVDKNIVEANRTIIATKINELREYKIPFVNLWIDYMLIKNDHLRTLELTDKVFKKFGGISFKRKSFLMALFKKKSHLLESRKSYPFH
ncbi:MAG: hypothetical protein L3J19_09220 [Sulfurimonas sp.]|nr:hypothetical protein [Sulfurimonas sp.]